MDRKTYRDAFDQIPFSAGFQERTANLLRQRARELEKENKIVNFSRTKKLAVTAAAAVALLIVSVSAALVWLTPAQVAELYGQSLLAEAFEGRLKVGKCNIDENMQLAQTYRISSIPAFVVFKGGKPVANYVGAMSAADFQAKIEQVLA